MGFYRTHNCASINSALATQSIKISGWVHRTRDHGGVKFIDLRDRYGITQIKFDPIENGHIMDEVDKIRNEWVIK